MKLHTCILSLCTIASAAVTQTSTPATGLHVCRSENQIPCTIDARTFHGTIGTVDPLTVESAANPAAPREANPENTSTSTPQAGKATEHGMWGLPKGVSIVILVAISIGGLMVASLLGGAIAGLRWLQKRQMKILT